MRYLILAATTALMLAGCGGPVTQAGARLVDETCAQFNANPLVGMASRQQFVGAINAFTVQGNYTASDCNNDGQPDFEIDANGQPIPPGVPE